MSSPQSRRQAYKVGPSQAPVPQCGPDEYVWRNFFASGCKPKSLDLRREGRGAQSLWSKVRAGSFTPRQSRMIQANGLNTEEYYRKATRSRY